MQPSAGVTWLSELLFHSLIFNLVCFVELVAVNFGMVASAWLLANDQVYAKEQKRMRSEQEELSRTCGSTACSSRASASALETQSGRALEERDEEGAVSSQEVRIGGHLYTSAGAGALGNAADEDSKPAGEEEGLERNAVASARKVSIATRIKVALDADGDGNVSFCELVCQNSVPGLTLTPNPNPNPKPNPILNPNP